jgi:hypothetical protein
MADNPDTHPQAVSIISVADIPHAPIIFFDGVPAFGHANGVFSLTLAAGRTWVGTDGAVVTDHVVVAYLRGNAQALFSLQQAIEKAALLAAPTQEGKAN